MKLKLFILTICILLMPAGAFGGIEGTPTVVSTDDDFFLVFDYSGDGTLSKIAGSEVRGTGGGGSNVTGPSTHLASYSAIWGAANSTNLLEGYLITDAGKNLAGDGNITAQRATLGLGTAAVHAADQDVETSDNVTFNKVTATEGIICGSSATPGIKFDDSDTLQETIDAYIYANATDATNGTEDVDLHGEIIVNGTTETSRMHLDADGNNNFPGADMNIDTGKVYKINNVQIASAALSNDASLAKATGDAYTGTHNFDGANVEIPNSGTLPATCTVGQHYMDTNATTGQRFYLCETTNSWVKQGDGGGGGNMTALDDIADPDAVTSITCADNETLTFLSSEDKGTFLSIQDDDISLSDTTTLEELHWSAATYDGTSSAIYLNMKDYTTTAYTFSGAQFSCYRPMISYEGNVAGAGYEAFTVSQNLEAMDGAAEYCRGFYVTWTNANHSAGVLHAFDAEDITGDPDATEIAYRVGTGWDHAFNAESGDFYTSHALDWDLIDNNAAGISFDATGKEGILRIVTTDVGEGVTMSGTLAVTGGVDFGGADDLEIPNGNNPVTDTEGQIAHDTDDAALEVYSTRFTASVLTAPEEITLLAVILAEPDQLQPIADAWPLYHFPAETYPHGVTIRSIHIATSVTCTDALNFEEWSNNGTAWNTDATTEAITLSGTYTEDDGALTDAAYDADDWMYVDLPASPTDIGYWTITATITINPGD